jgi:hypothetical protein
MPFEHRDCNIELGKPRLSNLRNRSLHNDLEVNAAAMDDGGTDDESRRGISQPGGSQEDAIKS